MPLMLSQNTEAVQLWETVNTGVKVQLFLASVAALSAGFTFELVFRRIQQTAEQQVNQPILPSSGPGDNDRRP